MYYARDLFVKRGPLSTLWLAGSLMRKLTKNQILQADVTKMCDVVTAPPVALALPTQSTLLRGVVRIENRKAVYLLEDAERAEGKLTAPKARQELTTADPKKIRAKHDAITYTDPEQAQLEEDQFPGMDDLALMVEGGDLAMLDADITDSQLRKADELAFSARQQDITLGSQDLGGIGMEDLDLDLGGLDQQIAFDDFGAGADEAPLHLDSDLMPPGAVSPAISELQQPAVYDVALDALQAPVRKKVKKGKRAFLPEEDEATEIDDAALRRQLHETHDLQMERPDVLPSYLAREDIPEALQEPSGVDHARSAGVPDEWRDVMQRVNALLPIVDEAGRVPFEVEAEFGADVGWDVDFGGADIDEQRAREEASFATGGDLDDLSRSMDIERGAEMEQGQLFAESQEVSGVERERRVRERAKGVQIVSELETPDVGVPESQFELPIEEIREKVPRPTLGRKEVNKYTEIFRNELDKKFGRLARAGAAPSIVFDPFLTELLQGAPVRRDRALAFYQLLVLSSLDIIKIAQDTDFGEVVITKGPKWAVRWSSSQMFGSSATPSQ